MVMNEDVVCNTYVNNYIKYNIPKLEYECHLCKRAHNYMRKHCIKKTKCRYCGLIFDSGNLMFPYNKISIGEKSF